MMMVARLRGAFDRLIVRNTMPHFMNLTTFSGKKRRTFYRFQVALCVSFMLHFVALWKFASFSSAIPATDNFRLQAQLVGPAKTVDRYPVKDENSALATVPEENTQFSSSVGRSVSDAIAEKLEYRSKPASASPAIVTPANKAEVAPSAPLENTRQVSQSPGIPLPGVTGRVSRAEIEFKMVSGTEESSLGVVRHLFSSEVRETGEFYSLSIAPVPSEQSPNSMEPWQLTLSGHVSGNGLSARSYELTGASSARLFALREIPSVSANQKGQTPDGILDRQSLLYHFSRQPPSFDGGGVWLADGSSHGYYRYRVVGFELQLIPPHGNVRTLKLRLSETETGEFIELWLAPDLNYLPVRVRHVDKKGVITEQMATLLNFN